MAPNTGVPQRRLSDNGIGYDGSPFADSPHPEHMVGSAGWTDFWNRLDWA
jgi:hypothetical protein